MNKFFYVVILFLVITIEQTFSNDKKIALLYPEYTLSIPGENKTWIQQNYYQWELFLIQNKFKYDVIKDSDLEGGLSGDYSTLVLPAVKSLSSTEINVIKDFLSEGNSIFATKSMGVLDVDGKWRGWNELEEIFGLSFVSETSEKEYSKIHSLFGGTPLSHNIPPGFRLQITTYDRPIEVKVNSQNTKSIGYWQNSEIPFEGKRSSDNSTSIVYGKYGKGKFVWMGFEYSAVVGAKKHQQYANQLLVNIINWLNDELIIQFDTWPKGAKSAAVFSVDVEFKFDYINNALDLFENEKLPLQFYVLAESIDTLSLTRLNKIGDVGLHGDEHTLFKWQDYNTQLSRLSNAESIVESLIGKRTISFRPPETAFDNTTMDVMNDLNFKILAADIIEDRAVPQFPDDHPKIMIIPKTGFDDFDIFQRLKMENTIDQANRYLLDFYRTYEEGGLYSLNFHTQMQCRKEFIDALIKPIQEIKSKNVWITTHDQVYEWWEKISNLKLSVHRIEDNNYFVEIINTGTTKIDDVVISIAKNNFTDLSNLQIITNGRNLEFEIDINLEQIKLPLPTIYPSQTITMNLSY